MSASEEVITVDDGFIVQGSLVTVTTASINPSSRAFTRIAVTAPPLCLRSTGKTDLAATISWCGPSIFPHDARSTRGQAA